MPSMQPGTMTSLGSHYVLLHVEHFVHTVDFVMLLDCYV